MAASNREKNIISLIANGQLVPMDKLHTPLHIYKILKNPNINTSPTPISIEKSSHLCLSDSIDEDEKFSSATQLGEYLDKVVLPKNIASVQWDQQDRLSYTWTHTESLQECEARLNRAAQYKYYSQYEALIDEFDAAQYALFLQLSKKFANIAPKK